MAQHIDYHRVRRLALQGLCSLDVQGEKAIDLILQFIDESRESEETLAQARQRFNDTFLTEYFSALAYMRQKDYTNALQRLTSAEVIASATDTNRLTHVFYFQLGSACERGGRWADGENYLKKCLKISPDFTSTFIAL